MTLLGMLSVPVMEGVRPVPVRIVYGNILTIAAEALVLPCNGSGIMGFVSLAGEVRRFAGRSLYLAYRARCPMEV